MAKPRVFVSSTYYDMKHIRSSLDNFIDSLGFDSIISEKGNVAYAHNAPLDQSCYREVGTADIFVILIGGRYGSAASSEQRKPERSFFERYESITKSKQDEAVKRDIPIYILIESAVYAEYQTYLRNKENTEIKYAHVDSVNVFSLIEEILTRVRNNPMQTFDRFSDIESWLKEQWAGLFREYLNRESSASQLATLSDQVTTLQEVNKTLRHYLEIIVTKVIPDKSEELIQTEQRRLELLNQIQKLRENELVNYLIREYKMDLELIYTFINECTSYQNFTELLKSRGLTKVASEMEQYLFNPGFETPKKDFNLARISIGKKPFRLRRKKNNAVDAGADDKDDTDE